MRTLPILLLVAAVPGCIIIVGGAKHPHHGVRDTDALDTDGSGGDTDGSGADTDLVACADRTGGALVTLDVAGDGFVLWSTDDTFIDTAISLLANGRRQVAMFDTVVVGSDCDARYGFHVDPGAMSWADFAIEVCDGTPSYIDQDVQGWIDSVHQWCPWSAVVVSVDDRR